MQTDHYIIGTSLVVHPNQNPTTIQLTSHMKQKTINCISFENDINISSYTTTHSLSTLTITLTIILDNH